MSRHNIDGVLFSLNFQRYEKVELGDFLAWKFTKFNLFYNIMLDFFLGHEIEHYHCWEFWFSYCITCIWMFSSLKFENGLKKYVWNVAEIKCQICQIDCNFSSFYKIWLWDSFSDSMVQFRRLSY